MIFVRLIALAFFAFLSWVIGSGNNGIAAIFAVLFFLLAPSLYLFPTIEAWRAKKNNLTSIALLNVLLGWTVLGWVGALIWAASSEQSERSTAAELAEPPKNEWLQGNLPSNPVPQLKTASDELERLASLLDRGLLTKDEFEAQKRKLLAS
jgi:hypothetical protein